MKKILVVLLVMMVGLASLSAQQEMAAKEEMAAPSVGVTSGFEVGTDFASVSVTPSFDFTTSTGIASFSAYGEFTAGLFDTAGISSVDLGTSAAFDFDLGGATLSPYVSFDVAFDSASVLSGTSDIGIALGIDPVYFDLSTTLLYDAGTTFNLYLEFGGAVDIFGFYVGSGYDFTDSAFAGIDWGISFDLGSGVSLYTDGSIASGFDGYSQSIGVSVSY